jgi:septal ring factor EnvC (AmiA/AmiB activator)
MKLRLLPLLLVLAAFPGVAHGQERELRQSRLKLDSINEERSRLQREMASLQTRVRDTSRELLNVERQRAASAAALVELEFQAQLLTDEVTKTEDELRITRYRLRRRTADLHQRLRSIYKRGPTHTAQVLLTARSFGDLLNRYKYVHLITLHERRMIDDVAQLERQLVGQEQELLAASERLAGLLAEKETEVAQLQRIEQQRQRTLRDFRARETTTAKRIDQLTREQARLTNLLADLERRRREAEAREGRAVGSLTTRDLGSLNWPVDGTVAYRFGPERKPNGVVLKNQGIGIAAPAGTPVKAVESGVVELAGPFPGYGSTVIVSHGGGYRTLYLYLNAIRVTTGQQVSAGTVVGTVGGERSAEGPHIEFQVRVPLAGGAIEAVDPLTWLRARAGSE